MGIKLLQVVLTIEDDHVHVSIALTKESQHRRHITHFGPTVLKPTIAYNMLRYHLYIVSALLPSSIVQISVLRMFLLPHRGSFKVTNSLDIRQLLTL